MTGPRKESKVCVWCTNKARAKVGALALLLRQGAVSQHMWDGGGMLSDSRGMLQTPAGQKRHLLGLSLLPGC